MAPIVIARGTPRCTDFYRRLLAELEARIAAGVAAVPGERLRLLWDAIPIWPRKNWLAKACAARGARLVQVSTDYVYGGQAQREPLSENVGRAPLNVYGATKAAVISITQSTALGLIKHGINVNAIAPGVVDTPMWGQVDALFAKYENRPIGEKKRLVAEAVPAGRMGRPDDYRGIAVFLASADSDYVVAQTYNVDGGNWMS